MGTSRSDAKGASQVNTIDKTVSTDAEHWGGSVRSNDEASVMVVE